MAPTPRRCELLRARLRGFTRTLPRVKDLDARACERAWEAARRLREVLPILQLEAATIEKLGPRLRRLTRRLEAVRQLAVLRTVLETVQQTERRNRQAAVRVSDDIARLAERARTDLLRRKVGNDVRRVTEKLEAVLLELKTDSDDRARIRAMQWAAKARVARRATNMKETVSAAGSVYLPGRLRAVRAAIRKLRFGVEIASEIAGGVSAADLRTLTRIQALLTRLDDFQMLVDRARDVQGSLATPDVKAWRDLDAFVLLLENQCRGFHARYVRERAALEAMCDRLVARAPADRGATRKVS